MSAPAPQPVATPERFFNAINSFQFTESIKAAIELDLFTAIAEGNATPASIAGRCRIAERGARILCDFLTIHGFLAKNGADYSLSPDAALFLNRHSPAYAGSAIEFLLTERVRQAHLRLTEAVRLGGTALGHGTLEPENPDWVQFAKAMMPMMALPAELLAAELRRGGESRKVLDIAASHGLYGIAVANLNPSAQIYALDWSNVLAVAEHNAREMGVSGRYHLLPGSAFDVDYGEGFDLVLIANFIHHFDSPACTAFLRKVHAALLPGGRAAILEIVPNADRISPPTAAAFSMMMLATTPSGDAYTSAEIESMAKNAAFARVDLVPGDVGIFRLIVAHR